MASPRAVVIPFGVPEDGRGLGLGLAALVHSFALIDGESVALAQLLSRQPPKEEETSTATASPVERSCRRRRGRISPARAARRRA